MNSIVPINTPIGITDGKQFQKFQILGVSSFWAQTGNLPNDNPFWSEEAVIDVPVGTWTIVTSIDYFILGHGRLEPEVFDFSSGLPVNSEWYPTDHNWGFGEAGVSVITISEADFSVDPPTQQGIIEIVMNLSDENGDDSWFGMLGYKLTFLGIEPKTFTPIPISPLTQTFRRRPNWIRKMPR